MKRIIAICLLLSVVLSGCGSAAKKETTISSIAELINETQKEKPQGKKKLKWAVFDLYVELSPYQKSLYEALDNMNLPYEIEFINIPASFEGDYKACAYSYLEEVKRGEYDIITCPDLLNCYDLYTMMADEGVMLSLTEFLEKEGVGKRLKETYPSIIWDSLVYKDEIYGILTPDTQINYYAVFNMKYTEKYGINVSQVTFAGLEKKFREVRAGEDQEGNETFVVSDGWPYHLGAFELSPCELICIDASGDEPSAENILDKAEYLEHIKKLGDWGQEGILAGTGQDYWEEVEKGNFLVTGAYSYSSEAAESYCRNVSNISVDVKLQAVEIPEFSKAFYRVGGKTGVKREGIDPEGAFEVLAAVYSDEDLSNALVYGKENIDYQVKDGKAVRLDGDWATELNMKANFGNPFLTLPGTLDSESKKEELWSLMESVPVAVRVKNPFDIEEIGQEICQINVLVLDEYGEYFSGKKEIEEMAENIRKKMDEAKAREVLLEMNRQLKADR